MRITLGNYYNVKSRLHQLDPRVKLLSVLLFMTVLFLLNQPWTLALYAVFLLFMTALARIPLRVLFGSVRSIRVILLFAFFFNLISGNPQITKDLLWHWGPFTITVSSLNTAVIFALRLLYLVITSSLLLTLTTTPLEMADGLEALLKPLEKIKVPAHEIAMMMSIALRFIPTLGDEADKIMKAQASRGADYDSGKLTGKIKGMATMLVPLFVSAFKRADDLALAMEARCYNGGTGRTKLHPLHFRAADGRAALLFALTIILLLLLEYLPFPALFGMGIH